jgi:flagellum-specific ATP synthase
MPFKKADGLVTGARVLPGRRKKSSMRSARRGWAAWSMAWANRSTAWAARRRPAPESTTPPKVNPLRKAPVDEPLDVGVRAINSMLTIGKGQRVGLMAGSGVGKSVLLGLITRQTVADVIVVGLIGERNREVREFVEKSLGPEGLKRAVLVVAPADESPMMRVMATELCHSIAAHFRDRGQNVLLLVDSLTRYAMALREVALSLGEPPATRGYPPSVFSNLPQLVRIGRQRRKPERQHERHLYRAGRRRRPAGPGGRHRPRDPGRPHRADARTGRARPLSGDRRRPVDQPLHGAGGQPEHIAGGAQAEGQRWRSHARVRDLIPLGAYVPGADPETDRAVQAASAHRSLPVPGHQGRGAVRALRRTT